MWPGCADLLAASKHSGSDAGLCLPGVSKAGRQIGGCCARKLRHVDEHVRSSFCQSPCNANRSFCSVPTSDFACMHACHDKQVMPNRLPLAKFHAFLHVKYDLMEGLRPPVELYQDIHHGYPQLPVLVLQCRMAG